MKQRLIDFLAYLGIGQTKFEEKVGLSRGFINKIGENITLKCLKKITEAHPELNINWLKTGEGNMLKSVIDKDGMKKSNINEYNIPKHKTNEHNINMLLIMLKEKDDEIRILRAENETLKNQLGDYVSAHKKQPINLDFDKEQMEESDIE
jgi:hypothetical protein